MDLDSIDERQAFKLGFAAYCADKGMTPENATKFVKTATVGGLLGDMAQLGAMGLVALPAAAGLAIGGGIGHGAAKLNEPDITPEQIKAQEIANTYKVYTDRLKARRAYQKYRAARQLN